MKCGKNEAKRNQLSLLEHKFSKSSLVILWISLDFVMITPFAFLVLLIWVNLAKGLSILFISSKNQLFVAMILCILFTLFALIVIFVHLLILGLGLACSFFLGV
jgi:hypothetical protein